MRRSISRAVRLLGVTAVAAVTITVAPSAHAAGATQITRDDFVETDWQGPVVPDGHGGFVAHQSGVALDIASGPGVPTVTTLFAGTCDFTYADADQQLFTGGTCNRLVPGAVTSGFTFTFDAARFSRASASSTSPLPTETCTFDADFNESCIDGPPMTVSVNWVGEGPILTDRFVDTIPGTSRTATVSRQRSNSASAMINGVVPSGDLFHNIFATASTKSVGR